VPMVTGKLRDALPRRRIRRERVRIGTRLPGPCREVVPHVERRAAVLELLKDVPVLRVVAVESLRALAFGRREHRARVGAESVVLYPDGQVEFGWEDVLVERVERSAAIGIRELDLEDGAGARHVGPMNGGRAAPEAVVLVVASPVGFVVTGV